LAAFLGVFIKYFHRVYIIILSKNTISIKDVYWLSLGAILILKYRSGISDMFLTFINFSLLYLFCYLLGSFFRIYIVRKL
jgi:hypothetical protein